MPALKEQIAGAVKGYGKEDPEIEAALLSGMLLVLNYQIAADGAPNATPYALMTAVMQVGRDLGLEVAKIT